MTKTIYELECGIKEVEKFQNQIQQKHFDHYECCSFLEVDKNKLESTKAVLEMLGFNIRDRYFEKKYKNDQQARVIIVEWFNVKRMLEKDFQLLDMEKSRRHWFTAENIHERVSLFRQAYIQEIVLEIQRNLQKEKSCKHEFYCLESRDEVKEILTKKGYSVVIDEVETFLEVSERRLQ